MFHTWGVLYIFVEKILCKFILNVKTVAKTTHSKGQNSHLLKQRKKKYIQNTDNSIDSKILQFGIHHHLSSQKHMEVFYGHVKTFLFTWMEYWLKFNHPDSHFLKTMILCLHSKNTFMFMQKECEKSLRILCSEE